LDCAYGSVYNRACRMKQIILSQEDTLTDHTSGSRVSEDKLPSPNGSPGKIQPSNNLVHILHYLKATTSNS
jgi:hypothetical protein